MPLRLVFMGTPAFAVPTLTALAAAGHEVAAVYTQPPRPAGRRGLALTPSPIQREAERLGIAVRTPASLKPDGEIAALRALGTDVGVVVAYGLLLPQGALDAPRHGCLNGHGSLLPRWRGAAPIQRAVEAGDPSTGLMVMRMEAGLDTGPVTVTRETAIGESETAGDLHDRLSALCAEAMVEAMERLAAGTLAFEDQDALAGRTGRGTLYARKIDKSEAVLDLAGDADALARRINAFSPAPGAWITADFGAGPERLKLLRAVAVAGEGVPGTVLADPEGALGLACGTGAIRVLDLQRAGGRAMASAELLRGLSLAPGTRLVPA